MNIVNRIREFAEGNIIVLYRVVNTGILIDIVANCTEQVAV